MVVGAEDEGVLLVDELELGGAVVLVVEDVVLLVLLVDELELGGTGQPPSGFGMMSPS